MLRSMWLIKVNQSNRAPAVDKNQPESAIMSEKPEEEEKKGLLPMHVSFLILRDLSPLDRYRYSLASKEAYDAVSSFHRQAYRIQHILSPYFDAEQIDAFRLIQLETEFVISGSAALQFFDLSVFEDSDLDLYVIKDWNKVATLAHFLLGTGYKYAPRPDQSRSMQADVEDDSSRSNQPELIDYDCRGIGAVYSFVRESTGRKIQIITCRSNVVEVILEFHSTCVMNFISYFHAYALFPYATYIERRSIEMRSHSESIVQAKLDLAVEKYRARGWDTSSRLPSHQNALRSRSEFRNTPRCVGDSACWVIPLTPVQQGHSIVQDSDTAPPLVDSLRANSWYTCVSEDQGLRNEFSLSELYDQGLEKAFPFTFASIPHWMLHCQQLLSAILTGGNEDTFRSQCSIEDLIQLTHMTFDGKPDDIHERVRMIVQRACHAMPFEVMDWNGKQLEPTVSSLMFLVPQLNTIFNSFREDPACEITFRIDQDGHLWTWVVITLPGTHPGRLDSNSRHFLDDPMIRNLARYRVRVHFSARKGEILLYGRSQYITGWTESTIW
ncbi:hypothetical protein C8R42DRAFT_679507 [Lentinula raphanica]|nr:hypothetical protein C8R42DRAFT_679507 [Lentinula raphanica]